MSLKLDGFVKPFKDRGDSFEEFWEKFEVLADVAGWDTDEKKMKRLPLFFEGDAFLVFPKMEASDKADKAKVASLMRVFQCYA